MGDHDIALPKAQWSTRPDEMWSGRPRRNASETAYAVSAALELPDVRDVERLVVGDQPAGHAGVNPRDGRHALNEQAGL